MGRYTRSSRNSNSAGAYAATPSPETSRDTSPVSDTSSPVDSDGGSAPQDGTATADIQQRTFPVGLPRNTKYLRFYRRFPMSSYFPAEEDDKPYVLALFMLLDLCPEFFHHTSDPLFPAHRELCGILRATHPICIRLVLSAVAARTK